MITALAFLLATGTASGLDGELTTPADITQTLAQPAVVSGAFSQTRNIDGVPGGLNSQGRYLFWRDHGIYWRTERPVSHAITYRSDKTLYWDSEHSEATEKNIQADRHLSRLLMTIFSFDEDRIAADFDLHWQIDAPSWELRLEPLHRNTRRFLNSVTLRGNSTIEDITIVHNNGESLDITFSDNQIPGAISQLDCIALFNYSAERCEQARDATAY